jgi:hypothetical protein
MTKMGYDRRRRTVRVRVDRRRTEIDVVEHVIRGVRRRSSRGMSLNRTPIRRVP